MENSNNDGNGQYKIIKVNPMLEMNKKLRSDYYDSMKWAFTEKAAFALKDMIAIGIDPDLALYMLEDKWTEADIYDPNAIKEDNK